MEDIDNIISGVDPILSYDRVHATKDRYKTRSKSPKRMTQK